MSTGTSAPLTAEDSFDSRNTITRAIDSGRVHFDGSASGIARRLAAVSMVPGTTQLKRIPREAFSSASDLVSVTTAPFDTA